MNAHAQTWAVDAKDGAALIVGREDSFHLHSESAVCVDDIKIQDVQGKEIKTTWKVTKPEELELKVALNDQPAGGGGPCHVVVDPNGKPVGELTKEEADGEGRVADRARPFDAIVGANRTLFDAFSQMLIHQATWVAGWSMYWTNFQPASRLGEFLNTADSNKSPACARTDRTHAITPAIPNLPTPLA